jgi:peptidoglycan/LPS O-acetylase OafA/YrhL
MDAGTLTAPATAAAADQPTPSEAIAQAGEKRLVRVESLRAIAALGVLVGHTFGAAHGNATFLLYGYKNTLIYGTGFFAYIFFTVSGCLLYMPFVRRDFGGGGKLRLRDYTINRAVRIFPLYYFSLVVVLLALEGGGSFHQWWTFLTFSENYFQDTVGQVNGVLWTLVVELHFYLLLPLLAWIVAKLARGRRWLAAIVIGTLCLGSFILRLVTFIIPSYGDPLVRYSLPSAFFYIGLGMLLALLWSYLRENRPRWLDGPLGSADSWVIAAALIWLYMCSNYRLEPLAAVMGFLLMGACVLPLRPGRLARALDWRWLAAVGLTSYSLYIWQIPLLDLITGSSGYQPEFEFTGGFPLLFLIVFPVLLAISAVTYRYVESPFLKMRRRWASGSAGSRPAKG